MSGRTQSSTGIGPSWRILLSVHEWRWLAKGRFGAHVVGLLLISTVALNHDGFTMEFANLQVSPFDGAFILLITYVLLFSSRYPGSPSNANILQLLFAAGTFLCLVHLVALDTFPFIDRLRDIRVVAYLIVTPWLTYRALSDAELLLFVRYMVVAGLITAVLFLYFFTMDFDLNEPFRTARIGIWILPVSAISLYLFREKLRVRGDIAVIASLLFLSVIILSLNRSQYLQICLSLVLIYIFSRGKVTVIPLFRWMAIVVTAAMVIASMLGYTEVLIGRLETLSHTDEDLGIQGRIIEIEGQVDYFVEAPLLGNGAGLRTLVPSSEGWELSLFAHNSIMFYLMKFGVIGALVLLSPLLLICISTVAMPIHESLSRYRLMFLATYLPLLAVDLFSAALSHAPKALLTGLFLGFAMRVQAASKVRSHA